MIFYLIWSHTNNIIVLIFIIISIMNNKQSKKRKYKIKSINIQIQLSDYHLSELMVWITGLSPTQYAAMVSSNGCTS